MSIAGGVSTALTRADAAGARSIQVFTKNNNQWAAKPLQNTEIEKFLENSKKFDIEVFASHDCYLINLASPDKTLLKKSRSAFLDEIDRADTLKIPCLVFHPGAGKGSPESESVKRVAESLNWALSSRPGSDVTLTLETTAGQGTSIGHRFEQIAAIMDNVEESDRLAVCVDTCHVFAAGYAINHRDGYYETFNQFDKVIGLDKIAMFHLNDSKKELGSRVDRHEHIGKGHIGAEGFRLLVNDPRFLNIPMILETPKGPDGVEDIVNLGFLNALAGEKNSAIDG